MIKYAADFAILHASWHKCYYLKYSFKQKRANNTDDQKRPFRKRQAIEDYRRLFCVKGQEKVSCIRFQHLMWTLITELQDTYFLARIDGDFIRSKVPPQMSKFSEKLLQKSCQEVESRRRKHTQG